MTYREKEKIMSVVRNCILLLTCFYSSVAYSAELEKPSYDCEKAHSSTEIAICASNELSRMDRVLAKRYQQFISGMPDRYSRSQAVKLQQHWLHFRERLCGSNPASLVGNPERLVRPPSPVAYKHLYFKVNLQAPSPDDITESRDAFTRQCLKSYYQNAIDSLRKGGLQIDYLFLEQENAYKIGVAGIDKLYHQTTTNDGSYEREIETNFSSSVDMANDFFNQTSKFRKLHASLIAGLRFFLHEEGQLTATTLSWNMGRSGRCGHYDRLQLGFIDILDGKAVRKTGIDGEGVESLLLERRSYTCGGGRHRYSSWDFHNGIPLFHFTQYNSFYHWIKLPDAFVIEYDGIRNAWFRSDRQLSDPSLYNDKSADDWLSELPYPKSEAVDQCQATLDGFYDYLTIKRRAVREGLSRIMALQIVRHLLSGTLPEQLKGFEPTARTFLAYLDHAREVDEWQIKLKSISNAFPKPNHHYFMVGDKPSEEPFLDAGFYSANNCLTEKRSPFHVANMEEWIYLFWARRLREGNLEMTESLLRRYLEANYT